MKGHARKRAQTLAVVEVTGTRWCQHGAHEVDAERGGFVMRGRVRCWMCFACQVRTGRRLGE